MNNTCTTCNKEFKNERGLKIHESRTGHKTEQLPHTEPECGEVTDEEYECEETI